MTNLTDVLHEDLCTLMMISRAVLLAMKTFQTNILEKIKTHFMLNDFFFEIPFVSEIMWKHTVQPDRPQRTVRCMRFSC